VREQKTGIKRVDDERDGSLTADDFENISVGMYELAAS
jgi:hypothetical protein